MRGANVTIQTALTGLVVGLSTTFLAIVALVGLTILTGDPWAIPGVFWAAAGQANGAAALSFKPNGTGLGILVLLLALLYTSAMTGRRPQRAVNR